MTKFTISLFSCAWFSHTTHASGCETNPRIHPPPPPQDVSDEQSLELPQLYTAGQQDELFNYWVFFQAIAHGTATSLVNFFMTLWISYDTIGPLSDYQSFATVMALSGLLSVTMEVGRAATQPSPQPPLGLWT